MQQRSDSLIWARIFCGCGALSALIGYWRLLTSGTVHGSTLARGVAVSAAMLVAYVVVTVRVMRDLRYASAPRIEAQILIGAGIALFLVSVALSLR